ncbi:NADH/ubiquinone/plastoquinone (complex I) [Dankookia rubra]|uniref:NADH/ubiquinone/plastoquinone (Complex I) n=1 Tax=Dankookia rubra TaxID=1442381 RepID=A0A4R5QBW5_9PROT|nr:complex I subunit 5 family protein [Dankookia rubra]TDH60574.1 NADH/ubiquinone/plastoquinone (complex I) [Dankookia rubra]
MTGLLLALTVLAPFGMLCACAWPGPRRAMPGLLWLAPLPGLAAALLGAGHPPIVLDEARRFTAALDAPGALLLGGAALLWCLAGAYARSYVAGPGAGRFAAWWLLTLTGSLGVFIAGDLGSFYLAFAVVSLAAFGLVGHDGTPGARHAAAVYLLLAVAGEACLLLGFALLAAEIPGDSLAIRDLVAALPGAPGRDLIIGLLLAGFGLKAGLVPLHVWLPLAHPAAAMPASAVLSGAIIKAGIIGLVRFLPGDGAVPGWGAILAGIGLLTAFWGVAVGVTQRNPKAVLAYSSISQMGVAGAALGLGLAAGEAGAAAAVAFYALCHMLAKGALFLGVGVAMTSGRRRPWPVLGPALVLALGFGGLPGTGGALGKAAVKGLFGHGALGLLAGLSAAGSTLLMLHFCRRLVAEAAADPTAPPPAGLLLPWLALALAAVAVPWWLFGPSGLGDPLDSLDPAGLWPVLLGGGLALALRRVTLPPVPEGDLLVPVSRFLGAGAPWAGRMAGLEAVLRSWPAAGAALLGLVLALGLALLVSAPG